MSEWADAKRRLSSESAAEPGRYYVARAEYQRGIMDAFSERDIETVVGMTSSQVGKTTIAENVIAFHIDQDPSPMLILQPTLEMAETFSKDRLAPMLRDTPALRGKVREARSRDSNNTLLHKQFPGGHITMAGANSPASLASRPIRIVLCDEVDRYPASAGTEGDPVALARKRATAFWNRKVGLFSTPGIEGLSRIKAAYDLSDQRRFWVPCETCGEYQTLAWQQVKWERPPDARYQCCHCGAQWDDNARHRAVKRGEWRAGAVSHDGRTAGFHLNEIYSPWTKLSEMVEAFLAAKDHPEQLKTWVNTTLGETWVDRGDAPNWEVIKSRSEDYGLGTIQPGSLILTAGVDVQRDRLELSVYGWGRGKQSWLVNHFAIPGKPEQAETWQALDAALAQTYRHPTGAQLTVQKVGIDSGYAAQEVYSWARTKSPAFVMVVKGQDSGAALVGIAQAVDVRADGRRARRGVKVWPCNVSMAKSELYGWLRLAREGEGHPPGWVHFPRMEDEFFQQLTAEQYVTRIVKGYRKGEWVKTRERNEALDCRNYARFAANAVGLDRFGDQHWAALERQLGLDTGRAEASPPASEPAPERAPFRQQTTAPQQMGARIERGGGWLDRSRGGWLR